MWLLIIDEKKKFSIYWEKFEDFVVLRSNFRFVCYKFCILKQEVGELVDLFLKKVWILVNECKFINFDEYIIDVFIFGLNNLCVQLKFFEYDVSLIFNKVVSIVRIQEVMSN